MPLQNIEWSNMAYKIIPTILLGTLRGKVEQLIVDS